MFKKWFDGLIANSSDRPLMPKSKGSYGSTRAADAGVLPTESISAKFCITVLTELASPELPPVCCNNRRLDVQ
jgi:hypothetical protein